MTVSQSPEESGLCFCAEWVVMMPTADSRRVKGAPILGTSGAGTNEDKAEVRGAKMKKVVGVIRNECGAITGIVLFDLDTREKYRVEPGRDAEALYGRYPVYNEDLDLIGNKGLVILEKTDTNVQVMTCAGYDVDTGDEAQIIAKTDRLQMRIVNASVLTDRDGKKFICTM